MRKLLKLTTIIAASIVLVYFSSFYFLNIFFNPNQYKAKLTSAIQARTGLIVHFNGDLRWMSFPNIGLRAKDITINTPNAFEATHLAEIYKLEVGLKWLPLLRGAVKVNNVHVLGARIELIKNANGTANWKTEKPPIVITQITPQPAAVASAPVKTVSAKAIVTQPATTTSVVEPDLLSSISLENAEIIWQDLRKNKAIHIRNFSLNANHIRTGQPFPITAEFKYYPEDKEFYTGAAMAFNAYINLQEQQFNANNINLKIQHSYRNELAYSGINCDLFVNLKKETVDFRIHNSSIGGIPLFAELHASELKTQPAIKGLITVSHFNLANGLQAIKTNTGNVKQANGVNTQLSFLYQKNLINAELTSKIRELTVNSVDLKNVELHAKYANKMVNIDKLSAEVLQGLLQAAAMIDLRNEVPDFSAQLSLSNANVPSLSLWLSDKFKLSGMGYLHLGIKSEGRNIKDIWHNLNGDMQFDLNNGTITGELAPMLHGDQVHFNHLGGSIEIINGVLDNDNLVLDTGESKIFGAGSIDLATSTIHYVLQNTADQPPPRLTLSGKLDHPDIIQS